MPAGVAVKLCLYRFPPRIPYILSVIDIKVTAAVINRNVIIPVTGQATETGIFIE